MGIHAGAEETLNAKGPRLGRVLQEQQEGPRGWSRVSEGKSGEGWVREARSSQTKQGLVGHC